MALDKLTIIDGGGLSTTSDYRVGVITATKFVGPVEGSITATDATFSGNVSIAGTLTYEDVTNVDSVGIITARNGIKVSTGTATTALVVDGDARVTGILTVGTGSLTLDGPNNLVNVGTALTLGHTQGLQFHTQNLHSEGFEINQINASGIVTASQGLRVPNGSATTNYISVGNNGALRFWGTGHQYADIRAGKLHFRNASLDNVLEIQQDKDIWMYGATYTLGAARFDSTVTMADSLIHFGDTDTKIRFPTNDQISFETGGSEQMKVAGTNITLGTNSTTGHILQIKNGFWYI